MTQVYDQHSRTHETFTSLLQTRSDEIGQRTAFTFLQDGESDERHLTFAELDGRARAIATELAQVTEPGDRVLLAYEPGLEFVSAFFGCLYAGVIAVPTYPPARAHLEKSLKTIEHIINDCTPSCALVSSIVAPMEEATRTLGNVAANMKWIVSDALDPSNSDGNSLPTMEGGTIAFLQYTSGSTRAPRGVMVTHDNLLANVAACSTLWEHDADSVFVSWLPPYHDLGLIGTLLQPVYGGFRGVLMSPLTFLQRPIRWLRAISHYRAHISASPNFALDLSVRRVSEAQRDTLDLSCWRMAVNGAEPIRAKSLERFATYFAPCGFAPESFCPGYGMAEATLVVALGFIHTSPRILDLPQEQNEQAKPKLCDKSGPTTTKVVSNGQPLSNLRVEIVDPQTKRILSEGKTGEIWVTGPSVARGYWGHPEETKRTFHARLAAGDDAVYLRTGDLGFILDTELYITGRLKDLIIYRGRNMYPQDIEMCVEETSTELRPDCCAAFLRDIGDDSSITIVQEVVRANATTEKYKEICETIARAVFEAFEFQLAAIALVKKGGVPKTASGKLQRSQCRATYNLGDLPILFEWPDRPPRAPSDIVASTGESHDGRNPDADRIHKLLQKDPKEARQTVVCYLQRLAMKVLTLESSHRPDPRQPFAEYMVGQNWVTPILQGVKNDLGVDVKHRQVPSTQNIAGLADNIIRALDLEQE